MRPFSTFSKFWKLWMPPPVKKDSPLLPEYFRSSASCRNASKSGFGSFAIVSAAHRVIGSRAPSSWAFSARASIPENWS